MKALKTKIAAGVIATTLIAGTGSVFAATDAGAQFKAWYVGTFNSTTAKMSAKLTADYAPKVVDHGVKVAALAVDSKTSISDNAADQSKNALLTINQAKNTYNSQLSDAKSSLLVKVPNDFAAYTNGINAQVDKTAAATLTADQLIIKTATDFQGAASLFEVKKNTAAYKKSSTEDLAKNIADAKDAIKTLIAQKSAESDKAIRDHIDAKIAELEAAIAQYAADQVAAQNAKVNDAAAAGTQDALNALDALAAGINK
ncbi:hypothetical protein [Gorillibacterium sp. sgz500922]|uniref:hypothetical protein n=1 Tax=Gorillibacterium sp. sgz500922 TaxID=3446694 RepID=UPI003F681E3A